MELLGDGNSTEPVAMIRTYIRDAQIMNKHIAVGCFIFFVMVAGVIWAILTQLPWAEWQENPTLPAWIQAIGSVFALLLAIVVPAAQHMLSEHRIRKESAAYE